MRNLSKHGLAVLVTCWFIVFATGACAQAVARKERVNSNTAAQERRDQERLTEKHRQLHAVSRGGGFGFHPGSAPARPELPPQQERFQ